MNTKKSAARGVQESDVWAAADELIAQGLRPTIERVRQQIGRGSPNTVSPMLETWFATLGKRLGVAGEKEPSALDSVPDLVQRLAQELWDAAQEEAKVVVCKAFDEREQVMKVAEQSLAEQKDLLSQRAVMIDAQKEAMNQALHAAQNQAQDLARRLDETQHSLQARDQLVQELHEELNKAISQRELQQQKHGEELQAAAAERQRMAEQYAGNERHMLNEVDRARQELLLARKSLQDQERKAESRYQDLAANLEQSELKALNLHEQLQAAQSSAELAQERVVDLKILLSAQQHLASGNDASKTDSSSAQPVVRRGKLASARRSINRRSIR